MIPGGVKTWKWMSILVAIPGVGICWVNAHLKEKEEHEHHHRPEFKAYPHLFRRTKVGSCGCNFLIILVSTNL